MENELNKLIEQQNKEYEIETHQLDDDTQSNCDIDDFEQRLKSNKSRSFNDNDSDSDDDFRPPTSNVKKPTYQPQKQSRPLLSEEPDLLRQVQQMHQNKSKETIQSTKKPISVETTKTRQEAQQRAEDEKLLELLNSNNTGLKDKKLKELIQKNKELYVNLEKEKSTRQKLQKEIERIKEETDMHLSAMGVKVSKGGDANKTDDSMEWKKKYNDLERKLQEVKLQNTTLKNDFNKAMRVITREIGENISIDAVLSEDNTWKGRAQQIEVLKARVKELQAKVSSTRDFSDMSYMTDKTQTEMGMMGTGKSFNAGGKAKDRREELENVKIQCEALKAENDSLSEKVKALNSRKTVLEKENREMKGESERVKQILKEKSDNDDKYIAALKKEVERLKDKSPGVQTRIVYRDKPAETKRTENEDIDENLAKKELLVLKNELDKKEKIIKELISDKLRNTTNTINKENFVQETSISDQEKFLKLETMIKLLKQENEELSNMKLGIKAATPDSKVIKDLSLQNAQLRRKVDDLQQKLKAS